MIGAVDVDARDERAGGRAGSPLSLAVGYRHVELQIVERRPEFFRQLRRRPLLADTTVLSGLHPQPQLEKRRGGPYQVAIAKPDDIRDVRPKRSVRSDIKGDGRLDDGLMRPVRRNVCR